MEFLDIGPQLDHKWIDERDVDFRLQKAYQLMDDNIWLYPQDKWIDKYLEFITTLKDESLYDKVHELCPDIHQAVRIYDCRNNEPISALIIECAALAQGPTKDVATHLDINLEDTVIAYEKIFFDVRDRVDKSFFILSKVLKSIVPLVQEGIKGRRESQGNFVQKADIWRLAAWKLGWEQFKDAVSFNFSLDISRTMNDAIKISESVKRLYTSLFEDINPYTANDILSRTSDEEYREKELQRRSDEADGDGSLNDELIKTLQDAGTYKLNVPIDRKEKRPDKELCLIPSSSGESEAEDSD